jgi:DNA-binding winged helix-turn-helix (wHTH) protein
VPTFTRYRFGSFVVSPRQRQLRRDGEPVPLIPKYFDLLVVLVSRRQEAVSKAAIFDAVWSDVVVSDGALSQAVRTLRRTLGDDPRDPRFIRTVPRHGYQFVFDPVVEEPDELDASPPRERNPGTASRPAAGAASEDVDSVERLVTRLFAAADRDAVEDARERAEQLHALGTGAALAAIRARPNHAVALAFMRDARWTVPGSGAVRLLGDAEAARAILAVVRLRLADVRRMVAERWAAAAVSGATGGALAGLLGGLALWLAPTSAARPGAMVALAVIGFTAGAVGAGGIGAGLIAAEVLARSRRGFALVALGGVAGLAVAIAARALTDVLLDNLFGIHAALGSPLDGLVIGVAVGAGYALATRQPPGGGLAAPSGWRRVRASAMVGASCAAAGVLLAAGGSPLIGGLVHDIARTSREARLALEPLGRLIGEPGFGPFTRALLSAFEGGVFGAALTWGLTRRTRPRLHVSA